MYLLVYTGNCSSTIINGVSFNHNKRTANVDAEKGKLFINNGRKIYEDVEVHLIKEADIDPDPNSGEVDLDKMIESIKSKNNLEQLKAMADAYGLSTEGSKTELATEIANYQIANSVN